MPMFLVERNFAEQMELGAAEARAIMAVNAEVGVTWLFSFLSADHKKTYCLYEAPSAELIREAARQGGDSRGRRDRGERAAAGAVHFGAAS